MRILEQSIYLELTSYKFNKFCIEFAYDEEAEKNLFPGEFLPRDHCF
jgi:hypothetical protein